MLFFQPKIKIKVKYPDRPKTVWNIKHPPLMKKKKKKKVLLQLGLGCLSE